MRITPDPWEIEMILAIDQVWLDVKAEQAKKERENKGGEM